MQRLTIQNPETHFLFLCEQGAHSTVDAITLPDMRSRPLDRGIEDQLKSSLP